MLDARSLPTAIGQLLKNNNYDVQFGVEIHGAEVDIVAVPIGDPYGRRLFIEATIEYVDNTKYGKDASKFLLLAKREPSAALIIVSSTGFTPSVRERAEEAGVNIETYDQFFRKFERYEKYTSSVVSNGELVNLSGVYEEANFEDSHGVDYATDWLTVWAKDDDPEARWLIVLGEYGTGKTCLTQVLQYRWTKEYIENPIFRLPLRITLRDFSRQFDARALIHHALDNNNLGHINIDFIFQLIRQQRLILLLDGYDEMAQFMTPRMRRDCLAALAELSRDGARGILTSRPNYFTEDEEIRVFEALYNELSGSSISVLRLQQDIVDREKSVDSLIESHLLNRFERTLRDLNPGQTEALVRRKLGDDTGGCDIVLSVLHRVFRASEAGERTSLSGKPVIVSYLLDVLDQLRADEDSSGSEGLTEWSIYGVIVDRLMLRDLIRSPDLSAQKRRTFLESLALEVSTINGAVIKEDRFRTLVDAEFHSELRMLDSDDRRRAIDQLFEDLRSSATLTRTASGDGWIFSHSSLREFMAARSMLRSLDEARSANSSTKVTALMQHLVATMDSADIETALQKLVILWQSRSQYHGIGRLLCLLWEALEIRGTRFNEKHSLSFFNSTSGGSAFVPLDDVRLSRLNFRLECFPDICLFDFTGSELEELTFDRCDLSESKFNTSIIGSTVFNHCNLRNADFEGAALIECIFDNCDLTGADFKGLDADSIIFARIGIDRELLRVEGDDLKGFLRYFGAFTDDVTKFKTLQFHPKFSVISKILGRLSQQKNHQVVGLTQRGEAQRDPQLARQFLNHLIKSGLATQRQTMVSLTAEGRNVVGTFEREELDIRIAAFLEQR
ncbi:Pentapeptide repeat-containing protein [Albimonas donghaensis]|uniref:Pentapeptide repeat-containing protein n=1 Tax=Albimonas donghaensis TaxID=356660 RepID=A0A1H3EWJ9_9RHOB|nr:NACHT domain-containing protein [Albimonas donghaensis]SDX82309.1 Pentapeptide repeat-containing protein [Albimonas donghaensis]